MDKTHPNVSQFPDPLFKLKFQKTHLYDALVDL
jgi:hypothetical protein